jgi:trk system potassium uptake protein TrkH
MRGRFAPYVLGSGLIALAAAMALFTLYGLLLAEPVVGFLLTLAAALAVGVPLRVFGSARSEPTRREALLAVLLLWFVIPLFGAIPYLLSGYFSPLDSIFESMSGFTTTGATVLRDFESFPRSMFLWRSFSQWVGGIGIIVIFISVFPQLAIAGRQLFFAEAPGPTEERLTPRLRNTANTLLLVYGGLSIACALSYLLAGMSPYDAVNHAFTTLSAGGFSPNPFSFQDFASAAIDWVAIVFMFLAGVNFALQYRVLTGRPRALTRNPEFRAYLAIVLAAGAALTLLLRADFESMVALRHGLFQTLSILTTTGYASTDFGLWSQSQQMVLLMLMFVGGSAGSAAGGVKVVRWLIVLRHTGREVQRTLHPRAVLPVRLGGRSIPEEVLRAVAAFITLYVLLFALSTAIMVALGSDFVTAFTASIACIGNIGPGLEAVGPMLNFADLHPLARVLLIFDMYAGRLEVVTVFVLFTADWWRLPRRNMWRPRAGLR